MLKYRHNFKAWTVIFLIFLAGCETRQSLESVQQKLMFDTLVFENDSYSTLDMVRIEVRETGAFAMCSPVYSRTICSTSFQTKVYQDNPVYISWDVKGVSKVAGPIKVRLPDNISFEEIAQVVVQFDSEGRLTARFIY